MTNAHTERGTALHAVPVFICVSLLGEGFCVYPYEDMRTETTTADPYS